MDIETKIEIIKEVNFPEFGIAILLFKNNSYPNLPFTVQINDTDAKENVETKLFPNIEMATTYYNANVNV